MSRQLTRSRSDKMIAGVAGGIAAYFGWNVSLVRLIWAIAILAGGVGVWTYIIAWIILPQEGSDKTGLDSIIAALRSNGPRNPGE